MASQLVLDAIKRGNVDYDLVLEIQDDNGAWVDFSSMVEPTGDQNQLINIGEVEVSGEKHLNEFSTSNLPVTVFNKDNFWRRAPSKISDLLTVNGNTAVFSDFLNKRVRVRAVFQLDGGAREPVTLGTYLLDKINPGSVKAPNVMLTLTGLQKLLRQQSAETVKNGKLWYRDRHIKYIIRKILEKVHTTTEIETFDLPDEIIILNQASCNPSDVTDKRRASQAGRPPYLLANEAFYDAEAAGYVTRYIFNHPTDNDIIFFGVNHLVYKQTLSTGKFAQLTGASDMPSGYFIRGMWYDSVNSQIVGIASTSPATGAIISAAKCFRINATTHYVTVQDFGDIFNGNFSFRINGYSNVSGQSVGIGNVNIVSGENILIPFEQYTDDALTHGFSLKAAIAGNCTGLMTNENTSPAAWPKVVTAGYYCASATSSTTQFPSVKFSLGNNTFLWWDNSSRKIIYSYIDNSRWLPYWDMQIKAYDPDTGTSSVLLTYLMTIDNPDGLGDKYYHHNPLCITGDNNGTIYFSFIHWYGGTINYSRTYIIKYNIDTTATETIYDSSSDPAVISYTPLEMVFYNNLLYVSMLDRSQFTSAGTARYKLATHPLTAQNSFDNLTAGNFTQYRGLLYVADGTTGGPIACVDVGDGLLKRWAGTSTAPTNADRTNITGDTDFNIASNLIAFNNTTDGEWQIYGISAPAYDPQFYETDPGGRYLLWKYSKYVFPFRALYDFSGWTCWQAIEKLCQISGYIANYDAAGLFFFRQRPAEATAVEEFRNDLGEKMVDDFVIGDMHEDIYNECTIVPYVGVVDKTEVDITLTPDSTWDETALGVKTPGDVLVSNQTLNPVQIVLVCLKATGSNNFKYKSHFAQIETALSAAYTAGGVTLSLAMEASTIDSDIAATGDTLQTQDADGNDITRTITGRSGTAGTITIDSALPVSLPAGADITILAANNAVWATTTVSSAWAAVGTGTGVSIKTDGGGTWTPGDRITIKSRGLYLAKSHGVQSAYDVTSIARYEKISFPTVENRLLDNAMAKSFANQIVKDYAYPRFSGQLHGCYTFREICDVIDIFCEAAFPDEKYKKINAYIRNLRINPLTMRMTATVRQTANRAL